MIKSIKNWAKAAILGLSLVATSIGGEENSSLNCFNNAVKRAEYKVNGRIALKDYDVPARNIPKNDRVKILHISDMHFNGSDKRIRDAEMLAEKVNSDNPDVVVYTGDFVYDDQSNIDQRVVDVLSKISPKSKRFFVLGNHDYYKNKHACKQASEYVSRQLERAGIENLTNRKKKVYLSGNPINFHGLDDYRHGTTSSVIISPSDENETNVLLVHNLDSVKKQDLNGLDLILSGHLHAGEIDFGPYDGVDYLIRHGAYHNFNRQKGDWKNLSPRTSSYVSPGFATLNPTGLRINTEKAGVTMITLVGQK